MPPAVVADHSGYRPPPDILQDVIFAKSEVNASEVSLRSSKRPSGELASSKSHTDHVTYRRRKRIRQLKRACGYLGWLVCLPLFTFAYCVREAAIDDDDRRDDPCSPWFYDTDPRADTSR